MRQDRRGVELSKGLAVNRTADAKDKNMVGDKVQRAVWKKLRPKEQAKCVQLTMVIHFTCMVDKVGNLSLRS